MAASLNHALGHFGFDPVDDETIKRSVGWGDRNLIGRFVPENKVDPVLSVYRQHHTRALKSGTKFLPGAKNVINELFKQGYKLAVASNRPSHYSHIILKHLKIGGKFSCVLCADQVKNPKPSPDLLEEILKRLNVEKQQALFVGDMSIDVETGHAAGVRTVAVVTGSHNKEDILPFAPYKIISDIAALLPVIEGLK